MGEFTENGYSGSRVANGNFLIKNANDRIGQKQGTYTGQPVNEQFESKKENLPTWAVVLIVIGCIFLSPVILGLAASAIGIVFSIVAAAVSLVLGLGIASIVLLLAMFVLIIGGCGSMLVEPLMAFAMVGAGFICGALGILCMMATVFLLGICIPGICRGIAYICRKLFGKKEVA